MMEFAGPKVGVHKCGHKLFDMAIQDFEILPNECIRIFLSHHVLQLAIRETNVCSQVAHNRALGYLQ